MYYFVKFSEVKTRLLTDEEILNILNCKIMENFDSDY